MQILKHFLWESLSDFLLWHSLLFNILDHGWDFKPHWGALVVLL